MHLFVLTFIFLFTATNIVFAQERNLERYTPPPMFGDAKSSEEKSLLAPRPASNLDLINLDSISGRIGEKEPPERPSIATPAKAFKPPLPPKRPASFQVSQDYLDRITAPPVPSRPRKPPPIIGSPSLAGDSLNADLLAMDVMDIYENLNGTHKQNADFINIPTIHTVSPQAENAPKSIQLDFGLSGADLERAHAIQLDEKLLPSLKKRSNARVIIKTSLAQQADKQKQRLALSRAIAIRNYLELNGIERSRIDIMQGRDAALLSASNVVTIKRTE